MPGAYHSGGCIGQMNCWGLHIDMQMGCGLQGRRAARDWGEHMYSVPEVGKQNAGSEDLRT